MRKQLVLWVVLFAVFSGAHACFWKKKSPPALAEPTRVVVEIETAADINPSIEGRSAPLMLRIYQLKSYKRFERADFMSLYNDDQNLLGSDLLIMQEIMLKPNDKQTLYFEPEANTSTIAFAALFREYDKALWKAAVGVVYQKFNNINVSIAGTRMVAR